ncbi:MAG: PstS family phosphate ABC transporter substrate-binding protein [Planctomycetaceae bacterium]
MRNLCVWAVLFGGVLTLAGCGVEEVKEGDTLVSSDLKRISVDGSSTVGPITSMVGELFETAGHKNVQIALTITGTGAGFKEFAQGHTDINDASRPIKDSEKQVCEEHGVEFVELKVAMDGISLVVNPENDWVDAITVADLKRIWEPGSTVKTWKDVNPEWPDEEIKLFGPGRESGTFDYFTQAINGEEKATREDYSPSADDNVLVTGVAGSKYALGYFGYGYYQKNQSKLKLLSVSATDNLKDAVLPTPETVQSGEYKPLARPVFIYVNKASLASRPELQDFVQFYLNDGQKAVPEVGCVLLSESDLQESRNRLAEVIK